MLPVDTLKIEVLPPQQHIEEYCEAYDFDVSDLANQLGITRAESADLLDGSKQIDEHMAGKLAVCFGRSQSFWMQLQVNYDNSVT